MRGPLPAPGVARGALAIPISLGLACPYALMRPDMGQQILVTSVTINPGDGADIAALINAALADPAITTVILGEGLFVLHSPIVVPSGKTLTGAGRDLTILQAAEDFDRVNPGETDGVVNSDFGATDITLTDFSIDANKLTPEGSRLVGCFMRDAENFTVARVDVYNSTAYGHFAQGDANSFTSYASGTYDDCGAFNCQIAFEQMACDGVTLTDCVAGDGDGDLAGTYFHPLTGSKNITYINCTASGFANVGFELTANVREMENIRIIDCRVEMLGDGAAFVAAGEFQTLNLEIEGSTFISYGNSAAFFYGTTGTAVDSYFQGEAIGIAFFDSPHMIPSEFVLTNSHVLGLNNPAVAAAFGVSTSGGTIVWNGGSIEARGAAVIPVSGPLTLSPETEIIAVGFDAITPYVENGAAIAVAPNLVLDALPPGSLAGGSLRVAFEAYGIVADQLGIFHQGTGVGEIGISGSDVSFGGTSIGSWSGGASGADLVIELNAGATAAALAALAKAVSFVSLSDNPKAYRAIEFIVTDSAGASTETNTAITVSVSNDAPAIGSDAPGFEATLVYAESGGPSAIAPAATVSDVDSANFDGGSLTVQFVENGDADDRLTILSEGVGLGQIGVIGNAITYFGIPIGTFSGGTDGSTPLVISFNANAHLVAVRTVARAVAYDNVSVTPAEEARIVSFTVNDGDGAVSPLALATILFSGIDYDAVAKDDDVAVDENGAFVSASLFADNGHGIDWDPDGPAPQIISVNGEAADIGEEILLASGAKLTVRADGSYDYDPNGMFASLAPASSGAANSFATDGFTYALAGGGTANVTVTIHGVASPEDRLEGDSGDNFISGTSGVDSFFLEQGGSDQIDAGAGDDAIYLGGGLDSGDRINGGAGADTVTLFGTYDLALGALSLVGVERLVLENGSILPGGAPNLYSIVTADSNVANGGRLEVAAEGLQADEGLVFNGSVDTDGSFTISGGLGNDVLTLGAGLDFVAGGGGDDVIDGGAGDDVLDGGAGDDSVAGGSGNDLIDGGLGADTMTGGAGNDLFLVDDGGDVVIDGQDQGVDEVRTNLASFSLAGFANIELLTGGSADQVLTGNGSNNIIDGGAGADAMAGNGGHDIYIVDDLGDTVIELAGAGIDEVRTALGSKGAPDYALYVLPAFVENLTGTSAGAQGVRGNALDNVINMGAGADLIVLDDGGIDSLDAGGGNDFIYYGAALTGADITNGGAGTDTLGLLGNYAGASAIAFTAANLVGIERLAVYTGGGGNSYDITMVDANVAAGLEFFVTAASLSATETFAFNGSAETDGRFTVHGGAGNDTIVGGSNIDFMIGGAGADLLFGLAGSDVLLGGLGADQMRGGIGNDYFRYADKAESTAGAADQILDFQHIDRIDLSAVDADEGSAGNQAFTFIGEAAFNGVAGELRVYGTGGNWFVEGDVDGDGLADLVIEVALTEAPPLTGADFIL